MDDHRHLEELARRLWDERRVVEYLLFKLTATKLLLAADERRFTAHALREVERAVDLLRDEEERRDAAVRDLAEHWGLDPSQLTLTEVARRSPAPFDHTFHDHHDAFRHLAEEIEHLTAENRSLVRTQLDHVTASIDLLTGEADPGPTTYDASGSVEGAPSPVGAQLRKAL